MLDLLVVMGTVLSKAETLFQHQPTVQAGNDSATIRFPPQIEALHSPHKNY